MGSRSCEEVGSLRRSLHIDHRRSIAGKDDLSALCGKVFQEIQSRSADSGHVADKDCLVGHLAHLEHCIAIGITTDGSEAAEDVLIAIVEIDLGACEPVEEIPVAVLDRIHRSRPRREPIERIDGNLREDALDRADDQKIADRLALGDEKPETGIVVLHELEVLIPSGLETDGSRIVTLGFSLHRVPGKMRATQIHAEESLPVAGILVVLETHLPAGAAVEFGKDHLLACLTGNG